MITMDCTNCGQSEDCDGGGLCQLCRADADAADHLDRPAYDHDDEEDYQ